MKQDTLFLAGSYESQRIAYLDKQGLSNFNLPREIRRHFLYSCLLSEQVIQPIGHFYQSKIVQDITREFNELFTPNNFNDGMPVARYAINMYKENFQADAEEKARTFLGEKEFDCYHDPEYRQTLTKEAKIFVPYRRKGKQLDALADTTLKECSAGGSLYQKVFYTLEDEKKVQETLAPLIKAVEQKEYAILPEYIQYLDKDNNLKRHMTLTRIVLMNAYAQSCAQLYATAYVSNPIKRYYPIFYEQEHAYEIHYLDTNLFEIFLKMIPDVRDAIEHMNSRQLLELKESRSFILFKEFYIEFVSGLKDKLITWDIKSYFHDIYSAQQDIYHGKVRESIEDPPYILYCALDEGLKDQTIVLTDAYLDYRNAPIMGFVAAVMERVVGSYEKYLFEYYRAKRKYETQVSKVEDNKHLQPIILNKNKKGTYSMVDRSPKIGIITALEKECAAVKKLLQNVKPLYFEGSGAGHQFLIGEIASANGGVHTVALGLCGMGNNMAALRASTMRHHFSDLESIIMVGIAGGIPAPEHPAEHVRLGDIVVSEGIVQYDFGKETGDKWLCQSNPAKPSAKLLEAVSMMKIEEFEDNYVWKNYIDQYAKEKFARPISEDILHGSEGEIVPHPEDATRDNYPKVFYGTIASANTLLKSYAHRKKLQEQFSIRAVEMEASGIADASWDAEIGYLVVRGICDYCDIYKNDVWQNYAAMIAACYTRDLIEHLPSF